MWLGVGERALGDCIRAVIGDVWGWTPRPGAKMQGNAWACVGAHAPAPRGRSPPAWVLSSALGASWNWQADSPPRLRTAGVEAVSSRVCVHADTQPE